MIREDAVCLTCKYPLRHLQHHQCPECGRRFDPNIPGTYGPPRQDGLFVPGLSPTVVWLAGSCIAGSVATWFLFRVSVKYLARGTETGVMFACVVWGALTILTIFALASICRTIANRWW